MLETERIFTDFTLFSTGAVHIHGLDPDRGQDPDLARRTSPHLAALDPVLYLRKGKLHRHNHRQDLGPDRKANISSDFLGAFHFRASLLPAKYLLLYSAVLLVTSSVYFKHPSV